MPYRDVAYCLPPDTTPTALSLLKQEETAKVDIKSKRLLATWGETYIADALPL